MADRVIQTRSAVWKAAMFVPWLAMDVMAPMIVIGVMMGCLGVCVMVMAWRMI